MAWVKTQSQDKAAIVFEWTNPMEKRPRGWDYLIKQLQAMELRGTEADRIVGNVISNTLNCRRLSGTRPESQKSKFGYIAENVLTRNIFLESV